MDFRRSTPRWLIRLLLTVAITASLGSVLRAVRASSEDDAAAAAKQTYNQKIAATYNNRFSPTEHFLPSYATSEDGNFMDPASFPTAQYCGHCHQAAHEQWRESAHANSFRAPWYIRNVDLLMAEKGIEYARHCEGCHNPIALLSGAMTENSKIKRTFDQDGVTCSVCHSIVKVDTRGTGSYVMGTPAVMVDEQGKPITRPVSDAEILAHLDRHDAAVMKPFYRTSEYCAACHKAALPRQLNDYKWQRAISLYDEWQNASFAKQSPLPFYVKPVVSTCQTCHMQEAPIVLKDYGAEQGQLMSHRWLGANTLIPAYYHYKDQEAKTEQFLRNDALNVDLFALEHEPGEGLERNSGDQKLSAPLGDASFQVAPGERLTADVVIQNKGIGHSLVPEQRDMYESWVKFTVRDEHGKVLGESGYLEPNGDLERTAHSFTNRLINVKGTLNDLHQVWDTRVVAYNNTIQSGRSQLVRYTFRMPAEANGSVTLTASVQYRRFDQHFINFGMDKPHYSEPIVEMASASRVIHVGANGPTPPLPGENKDWMRWNNYGIGLLDAQQYAASLAAFQHVAKMRPDYADAYTNMAIVEIQWEQYDNARPHLAEALRLSPNNARALYYRALVERNAGDLDLAIRDLQEVAKEFPQSRDAHRELGFSYYQKHEYPEAVAEYQAVQGIDPDDLAAHYNLAILYRRTGHKDKAGIEARAFADQKDDPAASTYALEYLRGHPAIAAESVPWHAHDLTAGPGTEAAAAPAGAVHTGGR